MVFGTIIRILYLDILLKKLIDLELIKFWSIIGKQKDISKYQQVVVYAFEKSIPWMGQVVSQLPNPHMKYIEKSVLPLFKSSGRDMIYSLLSIKDPSTFTYSDEQITHKQENGRKVKVFPAGGLALAGFVGIFLIEEVAGEEASGFGRYSL